MENAKPGELEKKDQRGGGDFFTPVKEIVGKKSVLFREHERGGCGRGKLSEKPDEVPSFAGKYSRGVRKKPDRISMQPKGESSGFKKNGRKDTLMKTGEGGARKFPGTVWGAEFQQEANQKVSRKSGRGKRSKARARKKEG